MMNMPAFQISIRLGLVLGIAALIALTAALVHIPWSVTARGNVTDLALTLNVEQIDHIAGRMSNLLDDTAATQQVIVDAIAVNAVDSENDQTLKDLFASLMIEHPMLSSIRFARLDDRWVEAVRIADETPITRTQTTPANDASPISGAFWFKQAFELPGASWSDIYPLPEGGLGFTVMSTVAGRNGPQGVLAVSMALDRISDFLSTIKATQHAELFMTNSYRELVAVRSNGSAKMMPTHGAGVMKLSDSPSPLLRIADAALTKNGIRLPTLQNALQLTYAETSASPHHFVTFAPLTQMGLVVGMVVPETDILGTIDRNTKHLGYALLGFASLIAILVSILAAQTLAKPLIAVTQNARMLGDFQLDAVKPVPSFLAEVSALSRATEQMRASLASFKKYIPTEIVRTLFDQGIEAELGGEHRQLTIFFMDLVNFTGISEALGEKLIPFIGEYLSEMSDVVKANGGTIDKYIGDAVMAFWGAPIANENHAMTACRAALACQQRLRILREHSTSEHRSKLRARIGLNTGTVLVGNIGSRERLNYTVIGDPVNVASRLESLNKRYDSEILIGEDTYAEAKDQIIARRLDRVAVYGKTMGIEIFELLALKHAAAPDLIQWVQTYEDGLIAMRARAWDEAHQLFSEVIRLRGGHDTPSQMMIHRIQEFRDVPPQENWNGLLLLSEK